MSNKHQYKRIGILGGMSYESTADLYELIMKKHAAKSQDSYYPEVVIFSVNFGEVIDLQDAELLDVDAYTNLMLSGIESLAKAGAEFVAMASNTPHMVFDELASKADLPMRSLVVATREAAKNKGLKKVLLLGTKRTMSGGFYERVFAEEGLEVVVPSESDQSTVHEIVFQDLVRGEVNEHSKQRLLDVINSYKIDGVILGCTELPMILKPEDSDLPLLDTIDIQAEDILSQALVN